MILKCDCSHPFQDGQYGKGNRVHNYASKADGSMGGYRCTVCVKIKGKLQKEKINERKEIS